jgi:hypothetical protein
MEHVGIANTVSKIFAILPPSRDTPWMVAMPNMHLHVPISYFPCPPSSMIFRRRLFYVPASLVFGVFV